MLRLTPEHSQEILLRICRCLQVHELLPLRTVSRQFRRTVVKVLMEHLIIEPATIDLVRRYITSVVENTRQPRIVRHVVLDVALSQWEILHHLHFTCANRKTKCHSLSVACSARDPRWKDLTETFIKHLVSLLPNLTTLVIKPVDPNFQYKLLGSYESLVSLTLHSPLHSPLTATSVPDGWLSLMLPQLEEVTLIQETSLAFGQDSLPMLLAKYVNAPRMKEASIIGIVDGRIIGVQEFLFAFGSSLQVVKILGCFSFNDFEEVPLPRLPHVTALHLELNIANRIMSSDVKAADLFPCLQTFVLESDWKTVETGSSDVDWDDLQRVLLSVAELRPVPRLVCGYRGAREVQSVRKIFTRVFVLRLFEETIDQWDVTAHFPDMDQMRCDPLPQRTLFADHDEKQEEGQESVRRKRAQYGVQLTSI
ncbi:hypothetical protein VNI00_011050 [Paramarasmius palmivorus]|uniref:F-box domain-containing protein n=1 Tax=Paramarasmius palmivorus TaxID=297713 RepID=A0AAW0CF64_9AGAR